jgi:hypothetical protein
MLKKNLFVRYLEKIGLSKSAVRQYSDYYLEEESLKKLAKNLYNVGSIYEITSCAVISALYEKAKSLPVNKKWNNGLTAALKKYGDFIKTNSSSDFFEGCSTKWGVQVIQKIFFGAPGTGKSFKVNAVLGENRRKCFSKSDHPKSNGYTKDLCNVENIGFDLWPIDNIVFLEKKLVSFESDNNVTNPRHSALRAYIEFFKKYKDEHRENRTTFHPDYDYAQFVGAYKPKKEGEKITYSFVPQVFAKAYAAAWKQYFAAGNASTAENQVYLVIEEINRGNCAQIFGDIFQLLDRDGEGFSQYSIDADCDFATWLKEESVLKDIWTDYESKVGEGKLKIPPNLNILATMNTSDQSLFPMDSAFKRRFDWEYVPIKYAKDSDCGDDWKADEFKIVIGDSMYMWLDFLKKVNVDIDETTHSEDKQMGEFFIKPKRDDLKISFDEFRSKVLFYLWDSVYKDETERQAVFHFPYGDGDDKTKSVTFQSLFGKDAEAIVNKIMENLKVEKVTA